MPSCATASGRSPRRRKRCSRWHSCASSAYAAVLASFFPSHESELNQLVSDAGMSRVYSGYHYVFDVAAGQTLGRSVARLAIAYDAANGLLAAVR